MKFAIVCDIHDHVWNLAAALPHIQEADVLLGCGDYCSPFVVGQLAAGFEGPIHMVTGNNDGDLYRITRVAGGHDHVHLHGEFFEGELGGVQIALTHYPAIARPVAQSGVYDLVCCGHNHTYAIDKVGETLLVNPGPLMGYNPLQKADVPATFVIFDTKTTKTSKHTL